MVYRYTMAPIIERQAELDALVEGFRLGNTVIFRTDSLDLFRYKLYEALAAARELNVPPYKDLRVLLRVKNGNLIATPRPMAMLIDVTMVKDEAKAPKRMVSAARSSFSAVGEMMLHKDVIEFQFPVLLPDEEEYVVAWVEATEGLTLSDVDPLFVTRVLPTQPEQEPQT